MSPPLLYFSAYLGLFVTQVLAITCNAFLDIQYGQFGLEVELWALAFGVTLALARSQRGHITEAGKWGQGCALALAGFVSLTVFIPTWGFPRAGLAMLAALQVVYNCVTVTRRHLHLSMLISAVMVMFAASHYRADWSMLFYLVPYVIALVCTLVAEQINRHAENTRTKSVSRQIVGGQAAAIAVATTSILLLAGLLYAVTPQPTRPYLQWRNGQLSNMGRIEKENIHGSGGKGSSADGNAGQAGRGESGWRSGLAWSSPAEMRSSASRAGMPQWQRVAILRLADTVERTKLSMKPVIQAMQEAMQAIKDWLAKNHRNIGRTILALLALLLVFGLWRFIREIKAGAWIMTRADYLRLGVLGLHAPGNDGARQYYQAMQRLLALHDARHSRLMNTREYLASLSGSFGHLQRWLSEMTHLFEDARYGSVVLSKEEIARMRIAYREIYQSF